MAVREDPSAFTFFDDPVGVKDFTMGICKPLPSLWASLLLSACSPISSPEGLVTPV